MAVVFQVLDRRAENLRAGVHAVDGRHPQVLQRGRRGTDDRDLAGELITRARALRAIEILIEVAIGHAWKPVLEATPCEHHVVGVGHHVAEVRGDARRKRGHAPAAARLRAHRRR